MQRSNQPSPSKFNSKLKKKTNWDSKRNLVEKRLMCLPQKTKNEELNDMDKPTISFKSKFKKASSHLSRNIGVSTTALDKAEDIRANLPAQFPSFSKLMLRSHVTSGFWLSFPKQFCDEHLPKHDETIVLVDENDQEYDTKYLIEKNGLSGGWRGFSIAHELVEGDVLVFQLIKRHKFKVYFVRVSSLTELDGARSLLNVDVQGKPIKEEQAEEEIPSIGEAVNHNDPESASLNTQEEDIVEMSVSDDEPIDFKNSDPGYKEDIRFSLSVPNFEDLKSFEDFSIHADGLILDSEISARVRSKYYELCCSQNTFLHKNLIGGFNVKLTTGMILEVVNIADAIRAVKRTTPLSDLESWDRTLKAFEDLGMIVGFLRDRIHKLLSLSRESKAVIESKKAEKAEAEEVKRGLEERLLKIKDVMEGLDERIKALEERKEWELECAFREITNVSW